MHSGQANVLNEQEAAKAFSTQALHFDEFDAGNTIIQYKRQRVRSHVLRLLPERGAILELNAGTGIDAIYFAGLGHRVHATDIAGGMLKELAAKVDGGELRDKVTYELCSFTRLEALDKRGPYDMVFSNFAGLNCTGELDKTLRQLPGLVRPGGHIVLVLLPKFCLWETMLVFKGRFRTAFRRWFSGGGARARVEGHYFRCWYYSPSFIIRALRGSFDPVKVEGLCTIMPPSYIEHFAEKHPRAYRVLGKLEDRWKGRWPWKYIGDYYIISLVRR